MVTARLVQGDDPGATRIVSLVEDWSERDQLESARRARMQAEAASAAKSSFLSRMSHELRTPLNAILGFTQLLAMNKSEALPPQHQLWLTQIQGAGWHLLQMIEEVLDLSRIEAGELKLELRPVVLRPLLEECLSMVATDAKVRNVQLVPMPDLCGDGLVVSADATRLRQVLLNLLSNAVKYNRAGGQVTLGCTVDNGTRVRVDVHDTGLGMGAEQLGRLFRPFDRLGRESTGVKGAGIGLVIARNLAELMGGRLDVASREGVGSTFTLTLDRHLQERPPPEAPAEAEQPDAAYRRRRVLLVEDNELNIELMRGLLAQRPQVHLQVFQSGLPAAAAARVQPPDALILDINLPDIDGIELLRQLKADPVTADVPVMVISASVLAQDIQRASDAGASAFLGKPVVASRFLALLDGFLSQATTDFGAFDGG
jgi:signal transduction histidine kinase/CheY-like chemotaxis protein